MKDYYKILGIDQNTDSSNIKNAYKKLAFKWHPDKNKSPKAIEEFKKISEAYQILSNVDKKKKYDKKYDKKYNQNSYNDYYYDNYSDYYDESYDDYTDYSFESELEFHFQDPFFIFDQIINTFEIYFEPIPFHVFHPILPKSCICKNWDINKYGESLVKIISDKDLYKIILPLYSK